MNAHLLVSLASALLAAASAAALLAQAPGQRPNQLAAALVAGITLIATCEVLRFFAPTPELGRLFVLASMPGWTFIGPLGLHLVSQALVGPPSRISRVLPFSYAGSAGLLAVCWFTDWSFGEMVRSPWGWNPSIGSGIVANTIFNLAHIVAAAAYGLRTLHGSPSPSDRKQLSYIAVAVGVPLLCVPLTRVALPLLGYEPLRLGTLALAGFGAMIAWTTYRHGGSPLARSGFLRQILDAHPDGVALVTFSGEITTASEGLGRLVGAPGSGLVGRSIDEILEEPALDPHRELQEREGTLRRKDGAALPVAVSSRVLQDRVGLDFAHVVVLRDLRELVALRSGLVTSGRLAAIGQLAAGIAHEINNPMAFVRSNLSLLRGHWDQMSKDDLPARERDQLALEGQELLEESLDGVERTCGIVRDINGFAHAGSGEFAPVDLPRLLDNVLRVASPHLHAGIEIERRYGEAPPALGAEQELKQVFLNMILNAAHAIDGAGRIFVGVARSGEKVEVRIEDDGCGIASEDLDKVFDPFFTTKEVGAGTGMGLFISYEIVRNHGGTIRVRSEAGRWTRVSVCLPAAAG